MAQTKIKAGLFEGIIGNGTDGYFLMSNGDGTMTWSPIIINPTIASIAYPGSATAADPAGGETITVTGTGFNTGATVTVGGTAAPAVSYVSGTQITFTTPAKVAGDYDIVVTNTDTGSATYINGISYNGIPSWTTAAGSLGTFASNTTISTITLQATEPDAGTITFNITNGALPTGLSLTGANIDGTTSLETSDTLYTFTVTATDDESQTTPRTFTITVKKQLISTENFTINTYTGNGSTQSIEGKIGAAASFNGSSSKIVLPQITRGSSMTLSCWVKSTNTGIHAVMLQNGAVFRLGIDNSGYATTSNLAGTNCVGTTLINDGNWHHIVGIFNDGSGNKTLYVDGVLEDTESYSSGSRAYVDGIGVDNVTVTPACKIDQVRIFNKALSTNNNGVNEINELYTETSASATKSTTDIFDDGSGIALYEFEKGAIDTGTYPYGEGAIDAGQSVVFNGSSSYVDLPSIFNSKVSLTVSAWFKSTASTDQTIYVDWNNDKNLHILLQGTGKINVSTYYGGAALNFTSTDTYNDGNWHHIAVANDTLANTRNIWVDNVLIENNATLPSGTFSHGQYMGIGAQDIAGSWASFFNGSIDQVRIYSSALSAPDVEALISETNVPTSNLVAHYKLDGNANDETTNYNGTASNVTYSDPAEFPLIAYNGTPTNVSFVGTAFQPDLVWIKGRTIASNHALFDSVRGAQKRLESDSTAAEDAAYTYFSSFDSNGFTLSGNQAAVNGSYDYVAWCWKAAASDSTNTDGSITSTVRANQDAGFSIVKYVGSGANATVGHGLSSAPEMVIVKGLTTTYDWVVYHKDLTNATYYMTLNKTDAESVATAVWNSTAPSSSVISVGSNLAVNSNNVSHIAYCFHSVDGYQKVGSYTGTSGSVSVTDVGFRPRFVMIKGATVGASFGGSWLVVDSVRGVGGLGTAKFLEAHSSGSEFTNGVYGVTFTDNGFEIPSGSSVNLNTNGGTFIYLAIG